MIVSSDEMAAVAALGVRCHQPRLLTSLGPALSVMPSLKTMLESPAGTASGETLGLACSLSGLTQLDSLVVVELISHTSNVSIALKQP